MSENSYEKLEDPVEVQCTLRERSGGGYVWEFVVPFEPEDVELVSDERIPENDSDNLVVGGPVMRRFTFRILRPGTFTAMLAHRRPWTREPSEGDRGFALTVSA